MKKEIQTLIMFAICFLVFSISCKKEDPPELSPTLSTEPILDGNNNPLRSYQVVLFFENNPIKESNNVRVIVPVTDPMTGQLIRIPILNSPHFDFLIQLDELANNPVIMEENGVKYIEGFCHILENVNYENKFLRFQIPAPLTENSKIVWTDGGFDAPDATEKVYTISDNGNINQNLLLDNMEGALWYKAYTPAFTSPNYNEEFNAIYDNNPALAAKRALYEPNRIKTLYALTVFEGSTYAPPDIHLDGDPDQKLQDLLDSGITNNSSFSQTDLNNIYNEFTSSPYKLP